MRGGAGRGKESIKEVRMKKSINYPAESAKMKSAAHYGRKIKRSDSRKDNIEWTFYYLRRKYPRLCCRGSFQTETSIMVWLVLG